MSTQVSDGPAPKEHVTRPRRGWGMSTCLDTVKCQLYVIREEPGRDVELRRGRHFGGTKRSWRGRRFGLILDAVQGAGT